MIVDINVFRVSPSDRLRAGHFLKSEQYGVAHHIANEFFKTKTYLYASNLFHSHLVDEDLVLTQKHFLDVEDLWHGHTSEITSVVIFDLFHSHTIDHVIIQHHENLWRPHKESQNGWVKQR